MAQKSQRARNFCVTVNNWTEIMLSNLQTVDIINYGIVGEEVGESGTPHLQGYLQLSQPQTISAFQKKLKAKDIKCTILVAKGSLEQNVKYCSKDDKVHEWGVKKTQGKRSDMIDIVDMIKSDITDVDIVDKHPGSWMRYNKSFDKYRKILKRIGVTAKNKEMMETIHLRDWQKDAVERLLVQDDRKVLWIIDRIGNAGKSFLSLYLGTIHNAFEITSGKTSDIAYAYNFEKIVVFDFVRQKQDYVNYGVIEDFKNGRIFSPKYESHTIRFEPAKVIVFSNWEPDQKMLSHDRWDIVRLQDKKPWHHMYVAGNVLGESKKD